MTGAVSSTKGTQAASAATSPEMKKLRKAAEGFEAVFTRQMLSSMRTASLGEGVFDSSATDQFRDMADAKLADTMAGKGTIGIADMLVKQWGARVAGSASPAGGTADAKSGK